MACAIFVIWQCKNCIKKYFDNPQGTKLTFKSSIDIYHFPEITVCPVSNSEELLGYQSSAFYNCEFKG